MSYELQAECAQRRARLLASLPKHALVILATSPSVYRNADVHYPYRQDSSFWYLTGYPEANAILVLAPGSAWGDYILFNQANDGITERWSGKVIGQSEAKTLFQADAAFAIDEFANKLAELLPDRQAIFFPLDHSSLYQTVMTGIQTVWRKQHTHTYPWTLHHSRTILDEMRLIKSDYEIGQLQKAVEASVLAHSQVMRALPGVQYEYDIEACIVPILLQCGCRSVAYPCIIGSGPNACILHYHQNNRRIQPGDLILIDAGGEYKGYAADITRTLPASGRFSPEQRDLYTLVLKAQKAAIDLIKPNLRWSDIQTKVVEVLTRGLVDLGLLQGSVSDLIANQAYLEFYMHGAGHWLGLDVHDVGAYRVQGKSRLLQPGMVLTVEPGLYIAESCTKVPERWRGLGVRIEDDVLVTKEGCTVLSAQLPKAIDEIEQLIQHG